MATVQWKERSFNSLRNEVFWEKFRKCILIESKMCTFRKFSWRAFQWMVICDRLWDDAAKVRCQCLCVLLIYITCRIFCAKGITVSQICCELLHFEMLVLENLEKVIFIYFWSLNKELYWNTINFNDIMCDVWALLNILLHFGMDKMYQRAIFTFPLFSEFCLATLARFSHKRSHLGFNNLKMFVQFLCPALGDRSHHQASKS
jgi:hypothetical protein